MSHTTKNKSKLLARVRRMKGQMEAIEKALDAEAPCNEILNMVASVRGAMTGLTAELIEEHIREHVVNPDRDDNADRAKGAAELIDVIRTYLK
ncbi:MAG: metal/formaldehyde-sensitive transcriptional repressor [Rhizobium sp.]|nr:metal/formaldehyde-sensitive transcriptional repressor [Rhizobium sp.]